MGSHVNATLHLEYLLFTTTSNDNDNARTVVVSMDLCVVLTFVAVIYHSEICFIFISRSCTYTALPGMQFEGRYKNKPSWLMK